MSDDPNASNRGDPTSSTNWKRLGLALGVAGALAGGVAGFFANINMSISGVEDVFAYAHRRCIEVGMCEPRNHFIDAQIRVSDPDSPHLTDLLRTENGFPSQLFAEFNAESVTGPSFAGISLELRDGPNGRGEFNGLPLQYLNDQELWQPEAGNFDWKLGFPILDVLVAEKGKSIDITEFRLNVLSGKVDENPYIQILSDPTKFGKLVLINESVHENVSATIQMSVVEYTQECQRFASLELDAFRHSFEEIAVTDVHDLDISQALQAMTDDPIEFVRYQFDRYTSGEEEAGPPPKGFIDWAKGLQSEGEDLPEQPKYVADLLAYGVVTVEAKQRAYRTYFCTQIPMTPSEGTGGGGIEFVRADLINLDVKNAPYSEYYDVSYRLDKDKPHFRSAFIFHSTKSAHFEIQLSFLSFGKTVYESEPIRLHIFVPKTTAKKYKLDWKKWFSKPHSILQTSSSN